jgi:hypothetical protein
VRRYLTLGSLALVILLSACGGDDDGGGGAEPGNGAFTNNAYPLDDGAGDCFTNEGTLAISCSPVAMDVRRLILDEDESGALTVTVELTGAYSALPEYVLTIGFDTDRNATTGDLSYLARHNMAADLELAYVVRAGLPPQSQVRLHPAGGPTSLGDPFLVSWRELNPTQLQVTIEPSLLSPAGFYLAAAMTVTDRHDRIPDLAKVAWPEREVIPITQR